MRTPHTATTRLSDWEELVDLLGWQDPPTGERDWSAPEPAVGPVVVGIVTAFLNRKAGDARYHKRLAAR